MASRPAVIARAAAFGLAAAWLAYQIFYEGEEQDEDEPGKVEAAAAKKAAELKAKEEEAQAAEAEAEAKAVDEAAVKKAAEAAAKKEAAAQVKATKAAAAAAAACEPQEAAAAGPEPAEKKSRGKNEQRVIRAFFSSTFKDFKDERTYLTEKVFPRFERLCADRGAHFVPIDLRWGITTEQSDDGQTLNICLKEVEKVRELGACLVPARAPSAPRHACILPRTCAMAPG